MEKYNHVNAAVELSAKMAEAVEEMVQSYFKQYPAKVIMKDYLQDFDCDNLGEALAMCFIECVPKKDFLPAGLGEELLTFITKLSEHYGADEVEYMLKQL